MCYLNVVKIGKHLANGCMVYCEVSGTEAIYRFLELFANHSQGTILTIPTYVTCEYIHTHSGTYISTV